MYLYVNRMRRCLKNTIEDLKEIFIYLKNLLCRAKSIAVLLMVFLTIHAPLNGIEFALSQIPEPDYIVPYTKECPKEYYINPESLKQALEDADKPRPNPFWAYIKHLREKNGYDYEVENTESKLATFPSISWKAPSDHYVYELTEAEEKCLQKLIYAEARGEPLQGQVAVGAVALNRWTSTDPRYPEFQQKTFIELCTSLNQFANISRVTDEMLEDSTAREAAQLAMRGWDPTRKVFPDGAKFFYNPDSENISEYQLSIRQGVESMTIGNHVFHDDFNK